MMDVCRNFRRTIFRFDNGYESKYGGGVRYSGICYFCIQITPAHEQKEKNNPSG